VIFPVPSPAHGIEIVPLTIRFGGTEFTDRLDLSTAEFWRLSAESALLPETAAPAPGQYEQMFRRLAAEGADGIVCVLSGELSATIQSATRADSVADAIRAEVVDSRSVTMGLDDRSRRGAEPKKEPTSTPSSRKLAVGRTHAPGESTRSRTGMAAIWRRQGTRRRCRRSSPSSRCATQGEEGGKQRTRARKLPSSSTRYENRDRSRTWP
jgi:hypothetical protein